MQSSNCTHWDVHTKTRTQMLTVALPVTAKIGTHLTRTWRMDTRAMYEESGIFFTDKRD